MPDEVTGLVKWFDAGKGFSFLSPADGSKDVFVHLSVVQSNDFKMLDEGEVGFYIESGTKGSSAGNDFPLLVPFKHIGE